MKCFKTFLMVFVAVLLAFTATACAPEVQPEYTFPSAEQKPDSEKPEDETPGEEETPGGEETPGEGETPGEEETPGEGEIPAPDPNAKPCFIWIDAAANFPDFANDRSKITRDLKKAAAAGFTDIVVDIRPTTGDVLFRTDKCQQVAWLGAWTSAGYTKITRTADWDYLQAFIEEGHNLGLRVYAGFNTMVGGNTTSAGSQGVLFRDNDMKQYATMLNTSNGIVSIMNSGNSAKFFNPVHPEVQKYIIGLLEDLAAYEDLDGIILDRCRFDGFESDFSDYTRREFEKYIGETLENWPGDVLPVGAAYGVYYEKYTKKWHEFRAKVIHDFIERTRAAVKKVNPDIKFGAYVGGWYASYYEVGVNWASPNYMTGNYYSQWASSDYNKYGYADNVDVLIIGAYASPGSVYGTNEWTMQGFCSKAVEKTMGAPGLLVGGPDVGNWDSSNKYTQEQENQAITNSVTACGNACDGYFLFDMIHLKKAADKGIDQWGCVKAGIDKLNPKK